MFMLITVWLDKYHIWENSGASDVGQNALGQSDCRIFKSTISLSRTMWWKSLIFCILIQIYWN